jgi:NADH:ubiquinone oxidoreductase subunit 6 (subunit J)
VTILDFFFWLLHDGAVSIFGLVAAAAAIAVVVSQNVARMAFWLIISLGSTAGLFFSLNADFVGAAQLLIYVGGTLVLLIFGVMLTASGPFLSIKTSPGEGVLAAIVGALLLSLILYTAFAVDWVNVSSVPVKGGVQAGFNPPSEGNTTRALGLSFLGARPDRDLGAKGQVLSSGYLLPFEIVSVHLLVVLIGAAYLARSKRRKAAAAEASS